LLIRRLLKTAHLLRWLVGCALTVCRIRLARSLLAASHLDLFEQPASFWTTC